MGGSQDGARGGFHLGVCIPVRPDGVSVSRSNQELIWSVRASWLLVAPFCQQTRGPFAGDRGFTGAIAGLTTTSLAPFIMSPVGMGRASARHAGARMWGNTQTQTLTEIIDTNCRAADDACRMPHLSGIPCHRYLRPPL